jgi:hypothetical protein
MTEDELFQPDEDDVEGHLAEDAGLDEEGLAEDGDEPAAEGGGLGFTPPD